jgi:thioredoxin reductase (NADPH)
MEKYQLIIIGAGPAGLTAGLFAKRYGINFLLIGQLSEGTINQAHLVENYPGLKPMTGPQLIKEFQKHSKVEIKKEQAKKILQEKDKSFQVMTDKGKYQSQAVILALGMKFRKLGIKNEEKFLGQGISYSSSGEFGLLKNKIIAVVGGGDSALTTALGLSEQAKKIYLIHRRDEFRGAPILVKKVKEKTNIEIVYSAQIAEAKGKKQLEKIILDNKKELKVNKLFIEVGGIPNVFLCQGLKVKMENNFIVTDKNQATNLPGLFAAGDIVSQSLKLIVIAAAQGATAATSAYNYLKSIN